MADFLNAVSAVFVIFLLLGVGYMLGRLGWLTKQEKGFISKYVVNIAVPVNCVVGMLKNFSHDALMQAGVHLVVGLLAVGVNLLIGAAAATLLKLPKTAGACSWPWRASPTACLSACPSPSSSSAR